MRQGRRIGGWTATLVLAVVAIAARWYVFGNPIVQIDEQFYLLVGGRMLHGAIPYVDIFDRKPIGLFLIYVLPHLAGGDGVIGYHLLALLFVLATARTLYGIARRVAPDGGALAAASLYILWLDLAGGEGGQAPVFYNLLVALAVALVLRGRDRGSLRSHGLAAMGLIGLALQIKYSVVFEGMYLGIMLIVFSRRAGRRVPALALDITMWIAIALVPTALAALAYAMLGHFQEWAFANVTSIVSRGHELPATTAMRIRVMTMLMAPLVLAVPLRRWTGATPSNRETRADLRFLDGWAASALLGVVLFGTWFNHYALPLFAVFSVTAAPLSRVRGGRIYLALLLVCGGIWGQRMLYRHAINRGTARELAAAVRAAGHFRGCAFVYDGMPAFYDATHSCLPTTRPFPAHLQSLNEDGATGIDETAEVARIMAGRPERVMTLEPAYDEENLRARAALYRVLRSDYVALWRAPGGDHAFVVYGLKGTVQRPAASMPRR